METNKNNPTMFIDTVNTTIKDNHSQVFFDSRNTGQKKTWTITKTRSIIEKKIAGIMQLVAKGININIILELENKNLEGTIIEQKNDTLVLKNQDDLIEVKINKIKDVIILET